MKNSRFQFENPVLKSLDFKINNVSEALDISSVEMQNEIKVNTKRHKEKPTAIVELSVIIGTEDDSSPFYIEATIGSRFIWDEDKYDEETIDSLLKMNAPSLLLSFIRPIISNITNVSPYPAYNIPFIDFTDK